MLSLSLILFSLPVSGVAPMRLAAALFAHKIIGAIIYLKVHSKKGEYMNQYRKFEEEFKARNGKGFSDLSPVEARKLLLAMSNRVDRLEEFVSEISEYDGAKVGFTRRYGPSKEHWLKRSILNQIEDAIAFSIRGSRGEATVLLDSYTYDSLVRD